MLTPVKPFLSCLFVSRSHLSCRRFLQGPHSRPNPQSWKTLLPCSLSLYLTFRAAGSFRDPLADHMLNPEKPSCPVSLSLCLSASLPLVPSGTPGRPHAQSWQAFLSCLSVSRSHLSCRRFLQRPHSRPNPHPEKSSCLVSLSLNLTYRHRWLC